jgi:hypothetical protein
MDVVVASICMLFALVITFGVIYPIAARSRRKRHERLLQQLAPSLGAGAPVDVAAPWMKAPTRGLEMPWRAQRAAVFIEEVGRYDYYWAALLGPSLPRIYVRPEIAVDRAGKTVGLNREVQTGDADFDAGVYLETDESEATVQRALGAPAMRAALRAALTGGYPYVRLGPGMVAVRLGYKLSGAPTPEELERALQAIAPVAASAPAIDPAEIRPVGRMRGDLAAAATVVAFMVAMVLGFAAPVGYADYWSPLRDADQRAGVVVTVVAWLALFPISWIWMRGHSRSFRNFLVTVLLSAVPLVLLGSGLIYLANAALDRGPSTARETAITWRSATSGRRSSRYLYVASWERPGAETSFEVSEPTYRRFHPGDTAVLTTRPGAFGWPWIERMDLRRPSPSHAVTALVRAVTGPARVAVGAACAFRVSRRPPVRGVEQCQTEVICNGVTLYGSESRGYFDCAFTDAPPAVAGRDASTSAVDHDPAMAIDTRAGTMSVWDTTYRGSYRVELLVTRVE